MKITHSTFSEKGVRNENQDFIQTVIDDDKATEDIMDTFKFMCEKFSEDNYSAIFIKID